MDRKNSFPTHHLLVAVSAEGEDIHPRIRPLVREQGCTGRRLCLRLNQGSETAIVKVGVRVEQVITGKYSNT